MLDLFAYTDWDLNENNGGDLAEMLDAQTSEQTKNGTIATVMAITPSQFFNVDDCCEDNVVHSVLDGFGNLPGGAGPLGPSDLASAFQWNDVLIPAGGAVSFEIVKMV